MVLEKGRPAECEGFRLSTITNSFPEPWHFM